MTLDEDIFLNQLPPIFENELEHRASVMRDRVTTDELMLKDTNGKWPKIRIPNFVINKYPSFALIDMSLGDIADIFDSQKDIYQKCETSCEKFYKSGETIPYMYKRVLNRMNPNTINYIKALQVQELWDQVKGEGNPAQFVKSTDLLEILELNYES